MRNVKDARIALTVLLHDGQPTVLQLLSLAKHDRDQSPHILGGECRGSDASMAFVHLALRGEDAAADEGRDECARLPRFLVDACVAEDMVEGNGIYGKEALVPLVIIDEYS